MELSGAAFPLTVHPRGLLRMRKGIDVVQGDLIQLLLTYPGERVMLPEFGTPLRDLFFESNDEMVREQAVAMIRRAIELFEPRVAVRGISAEPARVNEDHVLRISIQYNEFDALREVKELRMELPMSSAA